MREDLGDSKIEIKDTFKLPPNAKDKTGQRTGRLTAIKPIGQDTKDRQVLWLCKCDCGNFHTVKSGALRPGRTESCGCKNRERLIVRNTTHGLKKHSLYPIWIGIIQRCTNPTNKSYKNYGARGISIDDEWRKSFPLFCSYVSSLENYKKTGYSLDRIDNDKGYIPGNLKFSTRKEQLRNTRINKFITYKSQTKLLIDWAIELNINSSTVEKRLSRGWSPEKALEKPIRIINPEKKSKHIGLYWHKQTQTWRAQLKIGQKRITLSGFNTETEALIAYLKKKRN